MFFEPKSRYWPKGPVDLSASAVPLHSTRVVRTGVDVTLIAHGAMVSTLLQAAQVAADEGVSVEVLDLRSLSPIDFGPIISSVEKTGRLIVCQEGPGFVGVGAGVGGALHAGGGVS